MHDYDENLPDDYPTAESTADDVEHDLEEIHAQINQLSVDLMEAKERELRVMAEFQNYRKRNQTEVALLRTLATEAFVTDLLPVLDNFERTIAHLDAGATVEALLGGIKAVERQLRSVLEGQKVSRIPAVGEPFDPSLHEAVASEESELPAETVIQEIQPGYRMGEKVIRPAIVKVSKGA